MESPWEHLISTVWEKCSFIRTVSNSFRHAGDNDWYPCLSPGSLTAGPGRIHCQGATCNISFRASECSREPVCSTTVVINKTIRILKIPWEFWQHIKHEAIRTMPLERWPGYFHDNRKHLMSYISHYSLGPVYQSYQIYPCYLSALFSFRLQLLP